MKKNISVFLPLIIVVYIISAANIHASTGFEKEIDALSAVMAEKLSARGIKKVAVVDFTDLQGDVTEFGRFIAEEFSLSLVGAGKGLTVVDRTHLKAILKEKKLSKDGVINPDTARQLGKVDGVEALVTGTITPLNDSVRLAIKILDTETAAVIDAKRGNIPLTSVIKNLLGSGVISDSGTVRPIISRGKTLRSIEVQDFIFEVKKIEITGKTLVCTLMVTNKIDDRDFFVYADTALYDDSGNEFWPRHIQFSNNKKRVNAGNSLYYNGKSLISNVPTKVTLHCENAINSSTTITSLVLRCEVGGSRFQANLRNIPISKQQ